MTVRLALVGLDADTAARIERDLAAAGRVVESVVLASALDEEPLAGAELVVIDPKSAARPTVELLLRLRAKVPGAGLVVLTRHADTDDLYEVVRIGGIERYWLLPWSPVHAVELARLVSERETSRAKAEHQRRLGAETAALAEANRRLRAATDTAHEWRWFAAASPAMRACLDAARALASTLDDACLVGEPATGRSELARAIHAHGPRAAEPYVRLPAVLLRRGSLPSSADPAGAGAELHGVLRIASKWEAARGGTLFVADIEDLDDAAQAVLAGLVTGKGLGGGGAPRLIASVSAEPAALAEEGSLHPRLAERLATRIVRVPALRERREDLAQLAHQALGAWAARTDRPAPTLAPGALGDLARRGFEGNLAELREVLEQAAALATTGVIEHVPER